MVKSKFSTIVKGDSYILHNAMYDMVLKINDEEFKNNINKMNEREIVYDDKDELHRILKENHIIVEEKEDEMATLNSLYFDFERHSELCITMIVTRKCNFKCPYCYEVAENKSMSDDIYNKSIDFIINNIKTSNYKSVYISFFGGEPTLEAESIIKFMKKLNIENEKLDAPAKIAAGMTTNGYKLTPENIDRFLENGIIHYQITLDGLRETHNQTRILISDEGSWDTIIENIRYMISQDKDFSLVLRSNITPSIYFNIEEWLKYIGENFNDKRIKIHFEAAKNFGVMKDENFVLCENETEMLIDVINRAKKYNLNLGLLSFELQRFALVCYAARQNAWLVDWDGELKKCTSSSLDLDNNRIGDLTEGIPMEGYKKAAKWTSYSLPERCLECEILPLCYGRKCPAGVEQGEQCEMLKALYIAGLKYNFL